MELGLAASTAWGGIRKPAGRGQASRQSRNPGLEWGSRRAKGGVMIGSACAARATTTPAKQSCAWCSGHSKPHRIKVARQAWPCWPPPSKRGPAGARRLGCSSWGWEARSLAAARRASAGLVPEVGLSWAPPLRQCLGGQDAHRW